MQKITLYLWFEDKAEEAAKFYVSIFNNAKILHTSYYPEAAEKVAGKPAGSVMTVEFQLEGQKFIALNGGKVPGFEFTSAISLLVNCESQVEIDKLWNKLSAVPEAEQCGWLQDKYGITWQIVPQVLGEMLSDANPAKVEKVTAAFLKMKKFDIAVLESAYREA